MIDRALDLVQTQKLQIFPLHTPNPKDGLCTCGDIKCENQGKHPRTANGFQDSSSSPDVIRQWWARWGNANIGIPTGKTNHIVVLDVDPRHGGDKSLAKLEAKYGKLPSTFTVKTGSGGFHFYFSRFTGPKIKSVTNALGDEYPGIDIKGEGGYVVGAGSLHVSGGRYEVMNDVDLVDVPDWLETLLISPPNITGNNSPFKAPDHIENGTRNTNLYRIGCSLVNKGIGDAAVLAALREENRVKCSPPHNDGEVVTIAKNACAFIHQNPPVPPKPVQEPRGPYTQIVIADQFVGGFSENWRYNVDRKLWFFWNGKIWEADEREQIRNVVKDFLKDYLALVPNMPIDKGVVDLTRFIVGLNTAKGIRDILQIAAPGMTVRDQDLDIQPYYLNCQNGTLDLQTMEFRGHQREDFCSKIAGVEYTPGVECPEWKKHIITIFEENQELITNIQELLGYSLFFGNPDAVFAVLFGSGRNGKTVTLDVISHLLGTYAVSVNPSCMMQDGGNAGSDRIRMKGARLITATEPGDSSKNRCELDVGFVKNATGSDPQSARRLYCESESFRIQGLFLLASNSLPKIHDQSVAIWERIWCIPFDHYFMPGDRDHHITEKLIAESSGILNWLIEGYLRYQKTSRLIQCKKIADQTIEYRHDEDFYSAFFDSGSVIIKAESRISSSLLYALYEKWFDSKYGSTNKKAATATRFGRDMSIRFRKDRVVGGIFYIGICESGQKNITKVVL
jgi:putative DNA primase/helicase